ncbi:MAG: NTP transferase domain-containing protein [Chloroflexota bacterium]
MGFRPKFFCCVRIASSWPDQSGGVFFLVDQPQITPKLVETLIARHAESLSPIVAPIVDGQCGNPILFFQYTFSDLLKITGDKGGRQIFSKYPTNWVEWLDNAMIFDVDTLEDYARLLNYED